MIKNLYGNAVETGMQTGNIVASGFMVFQSGETIVADVLTLPGASMFELVTIERGNATGAIKGFRKILIVSPSLDVYGSEACKHVSEAASTDSYVSISYKSDSTIEIKPAATNYNVEYQVTQIM